MRLNRFTVIWMNVVLTKVGYTLSLMKGVLKYASFRVWLRQQYHQLQVQQYQLPLHQRRDALWKGW